VKNRLGLTGIVLFLLVWQVAAWRLGSLLLPPPLTVLKTLWGMLRTGHLAADVGWTLLRVVAGVGLGCGCGLGLGFGLAHSRVLRGLLDPLVQFLRPVSPFALTPLVILLFGLGHAPAIATILAGVLLPATVIVYEAIQGIEPDLLDIARIFGVAGWPRVREVELPLIRGQLLSALRVLFGVGWILAVGAEMLAANSGLGFQLMNARYLLDFPRLYALILVVGAVGWVLDQGLRQVEGRRGGQATRGRLRSPACRARHQG
jgi:NitT/TauT family transport system permease protein